jgi:hypothetical protein
MSAGGETVAGSRAPGSHPPHEEQAVSTTQQSACPVCDGKGFVTTVAGPRVRRRQTRPASKTPQPREADLSAREEVLVLARAFRDALHEKLSALERNVGLREAMARGLLSAITESTSVPLSELVGISHDLHWPWDGPDPCTKPVDGLPGAAYGAVIEQFSPSHHASRLLETREGQDLIANLCARVSLAWCQSEPLRLACLYFRFPDRRAP